MGSLTSFIRVSSNVSRKLTPVVASPNDGGFPMPRYEREGLMKKLTRKQFEEAVANSGLNPYARFVLMTYAGHAGYTDKAEEVYPSQATVAHITGIGKNTMKRYVEALVEDGWLTPASMHRRAQGYWLTEGRNIPTVGTLKKANRGNQFTGNVPMEHSERPHGALSNVPMEHTQHPHHGDLITKNNHLEEPKEEPRPAEPVEEQDEESQSSLSTNEVENSLNYLELLNQLEPPLSPFEKDQIRVMRKNKKSDEECYEWVIDDRINGW